MEEGATLAVTTDKGGDGRGKKRRNELRTYEETAGHPNANKVEEGKNRAQELKKEPCEEKSRKRKKMGAMESLNER